jgi:hypothetical protein
MYAVEEARRHAQGSSSKLTIHWLYRIEKQQKKNRYFVRILATMPRPVEPWLLLCETAMQILAVQLYYFFVTWVFLHLIQLTTFLGWKILIEAFLFAFLLLLLLDFISESDPI